jgi:hypothetical protein
LKILAAKMAARIFYLIKIFPNNIIIQINVYQGASMNALLLLIALTLLFAFFVFLQDIFPRCHNCGFIKLRPFFKIHKTVKLCLGYRGVLSVCCSCCSRYGINDYDDYMKLVHSKRVAKINSINVFHKY